METMTQVNVASLKTPYEVLRAVSVVDDTDFTVSTVKNGLVNGVETKLNSAEIIFVGTNAEDEAFTWALYGQVKSYNGSYTPAERIAHGTGALGDVQTGVSNEFYANLLAITTEGWMTALKNAGGANVDLYVAKLVFDHFGYDKIQLIMTKNTCASIGAYVRWN